MTRDQRSTRDFILPFYITDTKAIAFADIEQIQRKSAKQHMQKNGFNCPKPLIEELQ